MATWPASLPQKPNDSGYGEEFPDNSIETPMDHGPVKTRRRSTAEKTTFDMEMDLDGTEMDTFETFWRDTLSYGAVSFDWSHPRTEVAGTFKFVNPKPSVRNLGGDEWRVRFRVVLLP